MKRFAGKVALVTGTSSGIGEAVVREFASEGAQVVLLGRRLGRLKRIGANIRRQGQRALVVRCDVTKKRDLARAAARARRTFGRIDIVVANAGFEVTGPLDVLTLDDYQRQFDTNVFGVLRTIYATLEDLKRTRGQLVLIGSVLGHVALPGTSAYAMSKFAVTALAHALRYELVPHGVLVTLISPGNVTTEIRQVDNHDIRHANLRDPIPNWLRVSPARAARQIVDAVARRQRDVVLTAPAKLVIFVQQHAPGLTEAVIRIGHLHGRREPGAKAAARHPSTRVAS